jgi:acetyl esterase/lipase
LLLLYCYQLTAHSQTQINLYNTTMPNSKPCLKVELIPQEGRVSQITVPVLFVYKPIVQDSLHTAVIICPGGGYARLAIDHEGHEVAKALNQQGITAFVLKYRNPIDSDCVVNKELVALQDAQQAIKLIRENAKEYNINPNKLGNDGLFSRWPFNFNCCYTFYNNYNRKCQQHRAFAQTLLYCVTQ